MAQAIVHQMGALPLDVICKLAHRDSQPFGRDRCFGARPIYGERLQQFEHSGLCLVRATDVAMSEFPVNALQGLSDEGRGTPLSVSQASKTFGRRLCDLHAAGQVLPVEYRVCCNAGLFQISSFANWMRQPICAPLRG